MSRARGWSARLALLVALVVPCRATAQEGGAPGDSLGGYLRSLSDSTDAYFGESAADIDTAGLDSALAHRLTQPWVSRRERMRPSVAPWWSFNRVDGPLWGGALRWGRDGGLGTLRGRLGTAVGPNELRGGGSWERRWSPREGEDGARWRLRFEAGRYTERVDSDRRGAWLNMARAFLIGDDRQSYLRRDGARLELGRESATLLTEAGVRTHLEAPLATTTTWTLFGREPDLIENLQATRGRVREVSGRVAARLPRMPVGVSLEGRWSDGALNSAFEYRRWRAMVGADLAIGQILTLVPEVEYARLLGDLVPQAALFLGGSHSLRSLETNAHAGTGRGLARLDAIFVPDLLALARIPHPAAFPIQGALFTASGAVWGRDARGGAGSPEQHWPEVDAWRSEVGLSLLYRPGIPDPATFLRGDVAWGVGPGEARRVTIAITSPLDRIPLLGR